MIFLKVCGGADIGPYRTWAYALAPKRTCTGEYMCNVNLGFSWSLDNSESVSREYTNHIIH